MSRATPIAQWLKQAELVLRASYGNVLATLPFARLYPAIAANLDRGAMLFLDEINPATWEDFRREMQARFGRTQQQVEA